MVAESGRNWYVLTMVFRFWLTFSVASVQLIHLPFSLVQRLQLARPSFSTGHRTYDRRENCGTRTTKVEAGRDGGAIWPIEGQRQ
jgi:hypothetical protein